VAGGVVAWIVRSRGCAVDPLAVGCTNSAEHHLFLRVDDAAEARPLASDENSGGGTTPYLAPEVKQGILVAGDPGTTGALTLHLIASEESEAGRAAEKLARDVLAAATRLAAEGKRSAARALIVMALPEVMNTDGADHPELLRA
jgi:hypothetical protein